MQEINFIYSPKNKLVKVETCGCLCQADLLKLIEELPKYYSSNKMLNVFLNLSQSTLHLCIRELNSFIETVRKNKMPDRNIRIANLVCSCRETAFAMLFKEEINGIKNLDFEIFSTESAALNWLHLNWCLILKSVGDHIKTKKSNHKVNDPGEHTLKIWRVDPDILLQKFVIDAGGLRSSYLGPLESIYIEPWVKLPIPLAAMKSTRRECRDLGVR